MSKVKKAMKLMSSPVFEKCLQAVREGWEEPIWLDEDILNSVSIVAV